jgi:hypothetical protein
MKELNDRARALLQATQFADDPTDEDFDRVHGAVAARIATAVAVGTAATVGAKAATAATSATASVATTAAGGAALASASIAPAAVTAGAALPALKIAAWVVALSMTAGVGSAVVVKQTHTQSPRPVAAAVVVPAPVNPPPPVAVVPAKQEAALVTNDVETVVAPPPVAPLTPVRQAAPAQPVPLIAPATPALPASTLEAEVAMLRDANAALNAGDAARALALLDEHARRFPNGFLIEDADVLQISATCATGQTGAARELAAVFLSRHPGSSYASAVRTSCAGKK